MTNQVNLGTLRANAAMLNLVFQDLVEAKFPGCDHWDWSRAVSAVRGEKCRRNDDQSKDVALAGDAEIMATHDAYITALHQFYRARDGERGFLGGRAA